MKVSIDSSSEFVVGLVGIHVGTLGVIIRTIDQENKTVLFSSGSSATLPSSVLMGVSPEQTKFLGYQLESLFKSSNNPICYGDYVVVAASIDTGVCIGWHRKGFSTFIDVVTLTGEYIEVQDLMVSVITDPDDQFRAAADAALSADQETRTRSRSQLG